MRYRTGVPRHGAAPYGNANGNRSCEVAYARVDLRTSGMRRNEDVNGNMFRTFAHDVLNDGMRPQSECQRVRVAGTAPHGAAFRASACACLHGSPSRIPIPFPKGSPLHGNGCGNRPPPPMRFTRSARYDRLFDEIEPDGGLCGAGEKGAQKQQTVPARTVGI